MAGHAMRDCTGKSACGKFSGLAERSAGVRRRKNEAKNTLQQTQGNVAMVAQLGPDAFLSDQIGPISTQGHERQSLQVHEDLGGMRIAAEGMFTGGLVIEGFEDIVFNEPTGVNPLAQGFWSDRQVLAQD